MADDTNKENEEINQNESTNIFEKLKCDFFLEKLFINLHKKKSFELIKYNNKIKKRLHLNTNSYKEFCQLYSSIEIEIILKKDIYGKFINIKGDDKYYHIYFDNNKEIEIKRNYITKDDKVSKINIVIEYLIISFERLFSDCKCIESINFKKFFRNNINNMSWMFFGCSSLKEINLNNFNTNKVTNMYGMFSYCSSLKEINLSNFNTNNVTNIL